MRVSDNFKVVEKSRQIIHRPKNYSLEVNVADTVMEMVPDFPFCSDNNSHGLCTLLCTSVCTKNVFGTICSETRLKPIKGKSFLRLFFVLFFFGRYREYELGLDT